VRYSRAVSIACERIFPLSDGPDHGGRRYRCSSGKTNLEELTGCYRQRRCQAVRDPCRREALFLWQVHYPQGFEKRVQIRLFNRRSVARESYLERV